MKWYLALVPLAYAACGSPRADSEPETTADVTAHQAPSSLSARNRVLGLLSLPQLFGDHACDAYDPSEVALHAQPDSPGTVGVIRVAQPWTVHENGGCEGLRVVVDLESSDAATQLPTLEYDYEMPGAVVLGQQDDWFKIRLGGSEAWVQPSGESRFFPVEDLLANNLAYLAEPDGKGLGRTPGSEDRGNNVDLVTAGRSVQVLGSRKINGDLWLKIAVQSHSPCASADDPVSVAEGWLPAHTSAGVPIVWFHSRGC